MYGIPTYRVLSIMGYVSIPVLWVVWTCGRPLRHSSAPRTWTGLQRTTRPRAKSAETAGEEAIGRAIFVINAGRNRKWPSVKGLLKHLRGPERAGAKWQC